MPWSLERAADQLFSHADDLNAADAEAQAAATTGSNPAVGGKLNGLAQACSFDEHIHRCDTSEAERAVHRSSLHHTGMMQSA